MFEVARVPEVTTIDRPLWSVVIPVHNCAGYLAEALPEVVAQLADRDDIEILVVDDNSTDDPAGVVERLGRGRVRYRPNPTHLGAVGTFNRCLELASGELVHLLHGDDLVLPGFYAAMEQALSDPSVVAAVCRVQDVDAAGEPTYTTRSYRHGTGIWTDALGALAVSNRVRAPGIVVRRAAYEQAGGYRTDLPHAADWEMWTRLAAHGPVVFVDEVLACYRRHDSSDTSARARTGANIRERVTASGWWPPTSHPSAGRGPPGAPSPTLSCSAPGRRSPRPGPAVGRLPDTRRGRPFAASGCSGEASPSRRRRGRPGPVRPAGRRSRAPWP